MSASTPVRQRGSVTALLASLTLAVCGLPAQLHAQARHAVTDQSSEVIDALVADDRLITLAREPCDATRAFGTDECASLSAQDPARGSELWRTRLPIRVRGLIQLELADADGSGRGFLLRAHDRAVLIGADGRLGAPFDVPTSTFAEPVGFTESHGAFAFREAGGCGVFVMGRSAPSHGLYVRGVESHVYPHGGGPHDTVCFGFGVRPIGEVRAQAGAPPLVLVATTRLDHPIDAAEPTVVAFGRRGAVAFHVAVGDAGSVVASVSMQGSGAGARCAVETTDGITTSRVEIVCATGRVVRRSLVPPPPDAASIDGGAPVDAGAPTAYDRRGIALPRFPRCEVALAGQRSAVVFDGVRAIDSARHVLVLDQRGNSCIVVELANPTHPTDTLHRLTLRTAASGDR